jgi:hypothetical protein
MSIHYVLFHRLLATKKWQLILFQFYILIAKSKLSNDYLLLSGKL